MYVFYSLIISIVLTTILFWIVGSFIAWDFRYMTHLKETEVEKRALFASGFIIIWFVLFMVFNTVLYIPSN